MHSRYCRQRWIFGLQMTEPYCAAVPNGGFIPFLPRHRPSSSNIDYPYYLSLSRGSREKRYFLAGKKGGREEGGGEEGRKEGKREGRERRREEREDSIITSKHMTSMDIDTL